MIENEHSIELTFAGLEHLEIITDFQIKMCAETERIDLDASIVKQGVSHILKSQNEGQYLLAIDQKNQQVVSCLLLLKEWSDWRARYIWWIHSLYVIPSYRQKGIYKMMYHFLKQKVLTSDDIGGIRLYVDKSNVKAKEVYTKLGMSPEHYELYEWLK
jgi:GNAT superfamily N-acetyltransferase